ncbi:MAG TPA: hypothetical protein VN893_25690 [Bryobacteraceae bacterium]|nr:hypothetical protein [Bryobacteraceae bacterium]
MSGLPLVGLLKERRRIEEAVRRRESLLVLGPAGSGKTALVQSVTASIDGALHLQHRPTLHEMLATLATVLDSRVSTEPRPSGSPHGPAGRP